MSRPCVFGEVLFDRFPDGTEVLGGAPFNVAWNLQAFGSKPYFISRIGNDALGDKIQSNMIDWGMDTSGLQTDNHYATGTVEVSLQGAEPSFEIVANSAYDHIAIDRFPVEPLNMIYHGSLALRGSNNRDALEALKSKTEAPVFLDVNLRDPWWNLHDLNAFIAGASWIKLNENELEILSQATGDLTMQAMELRQAFDIEVVIVTLGSKGAFAVGDNKNVYTVKPTASLDVVDTVGAGDAFASVCMFGVLNGWNVNTVLERAQAFAASVVGLRGATTSDISFYQRHVRKWNK